MPEFLLRYKVPKALQLDWEVQRYQAQVDEMAVKIMAKIAEIFALDVIWEAREFDHSKGMPDFYVTAWITDNEDVKYRAVITAQSEILELMKQLSYKDQTVGCWFMRVRGKWGQSHGLKP